MRPHSPSRPFALAAVVAVVLASCSSPSETEIDTASGSTSSLIADDSALAAGVDTDSDEDGDGGTSAQRGSLYGPPDVEALAFAEMMAAPTTSAAPVDAAAAAEPSPSTTVPSVTPAPATPPRGRGGSPVTTTAGGGGGPVGIYQGVLATLDIDQLVTPPVVAAPTVGPNTLPLTGLPGTVPNWPAAVVKIDNGGPARPQTGLNFADVVIEEEVEGGVTRFAAIFHTHITEVGPIRSARTTDIGILPSLGAPLLLYSGANEVTDSLLLGVPGVQNRNAGRSSGYWRNPSRKAPSNLFSDLGPHWASAKQITPPAMFAYRGSGDASPGTPASGLTVSYRANKASWSWDGAQWLRKQGGKNHVTSSGAQVSASNVVVIETRKVGTGMVDSSGATVPEFVFVGNGKATVFTDGKRIEGTWTRPTLRSVATLTTADGSVIKLTPGRTWIELIEGGVGMLS